jgi:hypothetical protein
MCADFLVRPDRIWHEYQRVVAQSDGRGWNTRPLKLEFHGSRITSDSGLLAYQELDDALGLTDLAGAALLGCRRGKNTRHLLSGLLRQSLYGRLAG